MYMYLNGKYVVSYDILKIMLVCLLNISTCKLKLRNTKNLAPPFLSIFFWIKIDKFKNQFSLDFMPVQKTIVVEKIKCV